MNRKLMGVILLLMLGSATPFRGTIAESVEVIDANTFSKVLWEKMVSGADREDLAKLIRHSEPFVYPVIQGYSKRGIVQVSQGDSRGGKQYLAVARYLSEIYASEFERNRLLRVVRTYEGYDQKVAQKKLKGDILTREGYALGEDQRWEKARDKLVAAQQVYEEIGDFLGVAVTSMAIGKSYFWLGEPKEALKFAVQSLRVSKQIGHWSIVGQNLINLGNIYQALGHYAGALNSLELAQKEFQKLGNVAAEGSALLNIGNVYLALRRYSDALNSYQRSREIFGKINDTASEASALMNLGSVFLSLGQQMKSIDAYHQALEMSKKSGDSRQEASIFMNIGSMYVALEGYEAALGNFQRALATFEAIDDSGGVRSALTNIGVTYSKLRQYDKAIKSLLDALNTAQGSVELGDAWKIHAALAKAMWRSGKLKKAIESYQRALQIIERTYTYNRSLQTDVRSSLISKKRFVYRELIEVLLEMHRQFPNGGYDEQAFLVSELSKSRTFQELLAEAGAQTVFAGDEAFQERMRKERQLVAQVTQLQQRLTKERSDERNEEVTKSLKSKLTQAERFLRRHRKETEEKYPRYGDLKRPKPLRVAELQKILKSDESVLAYAVGEKKSASFVIDKEQFKLIELPIGRKEVTGLTKQFRQGLDRVVTPDGREEGLTELSDLEQFDPAIAYTLYQKIFQPVEKQLLGKTKLHISGDDLLYTVPFGALVDRAPELQAFKKARDRSQRGSGTYLGEYSTLHYLIDTYTITYLPSASVLRSLRKYQKPGYGQWQKPLIAFADPVFSADEGDAGKVLGIESKGGLSKQAAFTAALLTRSTGGDELDRLEDSGEEATIIAQAVKGKQEDIYLRERATEENVYAAQLNKSRYLLFSTHGLLGGDFSGVAEPALALTLIGNPPNRDGFLSMSEVLGLDLNAELTILSACNTAGRGEQAGSGEGFAGLTRSFMYAGTRSLLVSHWSVESQAARDLMVSLFRAKTKPANPQTLRIAKLKMKQSTRALEDTPSRKLSLSHPFFWAPFVLVGGQGPTAAP